MLIPLYDHNPVDKVPIITYVIIGLNVFAWLFIQHAGFTDAFEVSLCNYGLIPGELLNLANPYRAVLLGDYFCYFRESPPFQTLFTSMFMHANWLHLIGNMWFLWIFGDNIENALGRIKYIVFYLLCGMVAAGAQIASDVNSVIPMVGASGAISGVMGAYILLHPRSRIKALMFFFIVIEVPAVIILGMYMVTQVFAGLTTPSGGGGVAYWAHIGGFLAGMLLSKVMSRKQQTFTLTIDQ